MNRLPVICIFEIRFLSKSTVLFSRRLLTKVVSLRRFILANLDGSLHTAHALSCREMDFGKHYHRGCYPPYVCKVRYSIINRAIR